MFIGITRMHIRPRSDDGVYPDTSTLPETFGDICKTYAIGCASQTAKILGTPSSSLFAKHLNESFTIANKKILNIRDMIVYKMAPCTGRYSPIDFVLRYGSARLLLLFQSEEADVYAQIGNVMVDVCVPFCFDCSFLGQLDLEYSDYRGAMSAIGPRICDMMIEHFVPETRPAVVAFAAIELER